jgi:hypothetical protein
MEPAGRVSIVGAAHADDGEYAQARRLGELLAERGYILICGGLGGVMEAAARGASDRGGQAVGLLPGEDFASANPYLSLAILTGLGHMRNYLVVLNGQITVAIGGGYGTLAEIALAKKIGRPVITLGGWQGIHGTIVAEGPEQAVQLIEQVVRGF